MSDPIRVMICDDSAVMRRLIKTALKIDPELDVICEAKHGQDALGKMFDARPDLVVMDVEMPVMDGIEAVKEIRKRSATLPIIMFSSLTSRGAELTLDAIEAGASDFSCKPANAGRIEAALAQVQGDLIPKIRQWVHRKSKSKTTNVGLQASRLALPPAGGNVSAEAQTEQSTAKTNTAPLGAKSNAPGSNGTSKPVSTRSTQVTQVKRPLGKPATASTSLANKTTGAGNSGKQGAGVSLAGGSVAVVSRARCPAPRFRAPDCGPRTFPRSQLPRSDPA
ncbi:MAG: response regulator, partial [Planctomycetota bacterium]